MPADHLGSAAAAAGGAGAGVGAGGGASSSSSTASSTKAVMNGHSVGQRRRQQQRGASTKQQRRAADSDVDSDGGDDGDSSSEWELDSLPSGFTPPHRPQKRLPDASFWGQNHKNLPLWRRINWWFLTPLTVTPMIALYGLFTCHWNTKTALWAVAYYFITGLGITAGYHRLFAHVGYKAHWLWRFILMLAASGAGQGTILWWCRDHRAHHRYVDTRKDPYSTINGFWHAHIGWLWVKKEKGVAGSASVEDLKRDPVVRFQTAIFPILSFIMVFGFPTWVAGYFWGDYRGGFFFAGALRLTVVHHTTFCVNSLAHWLGDQSYSDGNTSRNSIITALLTLGEGYHNYHHEFPSDYRNGVKWYHYDPTKWLIWTMSKIGLASDLRRYPKPDIQKAVLTMKRKELEARAAALKQEETSVEWGPEPETLPRYTMVEVKTRVAHEGAKWLVLGGFVLDVSTFMERHPGGAHMLANHLGEDCSAYFMGQIYRHTMAAHTMQRTLRIGVVVDN